MDLENSKLLESIKHFWQSLANIHLTTVLKWTKEPIPMTRIWFLFMCNHNFCLWRRISGTWWYDRDPCKNERTQSRGLKELINVTEVLALTGSHRSQIFLWPPPSLFTCWIFLEKFLLDFSNVTSNLLQPVEKKSTFTVPNTWIHIKITTTKKMLLHTALLCEFLKIPKRI